MNIEVGRLIKKLRKNFREKYKLNSKFNNNLNETFKANEASANIQIENFWLLSSIFLIITWILIMLDIWHGDRTWATIIFLGEIVVKLLTYAFCRSKKGGGSFTKYLVMLGIFINVVFVCTYITYNGWLYFAVPIIISCRYFNAKFTRHVFYLSAIFLLITTWNCVYISPKFGFVDLNFITFDQPIVMLIQGRLVTALKNVSYNMSHTFLNMIILTYLPNLMIMTFLSSLCIMVTSHGRKFMIIQSEHIENQINLEKELENSRTEIMISQIQPHFIFNSLNSIYELCDEDPILAQEAIDDFATYLRLNIDLLEKKNNIHFEKELEHIKTYIRLEQMRFGDRLKIEYEINTTDFFLPALTVQPIVENSVKHGICKKKEGGTIKLSTSKTDDAYKITVEDDGVGFDPDAEYTPEKNHIGLKNVQSRLKNMCNATTIIESQINKGTKITILIPKEN